MHDFVKGCMYSTSGMYIFFRGTGYFVCNARVSGMAKHYELNTPGSHILALKQRQKSVTEYLHEFNFLARYAPDDVSTDLRRRNRFMNGLSEELQLALAVQDFRNFQHLVDKAIIAETKSKALEESRKRQKAT